jgi:hypothetical protein
MTLSYTPHGFALLTNSFSRCVCGLAGLLLALAAPTLAWGDTVQIEVSAGPHARTQTPARVLLQVPETHATRTAVSLVSPNGTRVAGQLAAPSLLETTPEPLAGFVTRELHFVIPQLDAGESRRYQLDYDTSPEGTAFEWHDREGVYTELRFGERPVLRYMYRGLDESTPQDRFLTYKVFHHLFDPAGNRLVTNGPDGHTPYEFDNILFPHHRGIFYGFNRCSYEGVDRADVWHCQGDDHQSHAGWLQSDVGPVLGRHRVAVGWHGKGKQEFIREHRELTAYQVPGGQLVEFASRAGTQVGPVKLDGDPQHAGFQFRAHNEVAAETKGETHYVRVDGSGKPGETRNWPQDTSEVDLPWKGLSFVLGGQRYTVAYLDCPANPKEARFSERDYGRFGSYFEYELTDDRPLEVRYRLWLQEGEMSPEAISVLHRDFVEPPTVRVVR